jgi:CYTH domain-containing protein
VLSDATDWAREPGRGRYARAERERRFLVRDSAPAGEAPRLIEDRYLEGLRLRLRRVTADGRAVHKLTQKVRVDEGDPSEVLLTNVYLSVVEYDRLLLLPGQDVVKTRTVVPAGGLAFALDEFHGRLQGLRLAEVEVPDLAAPVDLPEWLASEVTRDDRFSGGRLAATDEAQLRALLDAG